MSSFVTFMTNIRNLQNFCNTSFSQQNNIKIKIIDSNNVFEYAMYLQCIEMEKRFFSVCKYIPFEINDFVQFLVNNYYTDILKMVIAVIVYKTAFQQQFNNVYILQRKKDILL